LAWFEVLCGPDFVFVTIQTHAAPFLKGVPA
jgi:hypothetical protein